MFKMITLLIISFISLNTYSKPLIDSKELEFNIFYKSLSLGEINFKTSTKNKSAQKHFELGMKYLHSFMYDLAEEQFLEAQALDSKFVMAYYGELLCQKHMLWQFEDKSNAQKIIKKFKKNTSHLELTKKETELFKSVYILFAAGDSKQNFLNYLNSLSFLHKIYRQDVEISLNLALAKLGFIGQFSNDKRNNKLLASGRKLIEKIYRQNPHHPGAIHYHIHYFDSADPLIAIKAIPSATSALKYLNSSSHITHMSAHAYRRLNLWPQFIEANSASVKASDHICRQKPSDKKLNPKQLLTCDQENRYHSLEWLQYGALKLNKKKIASSALNRIYNDQKIMQKTIYYSWYYRMWARHILSSNNLNQPTIKIKNISKSKEQSYWYSYSECGALLANGLININKKQGIKNTLNRLNTLSALNKHLNFPYIANSCRLNKHLLLAYQAKINKNTNQLKQELEQAQKSQNKLISTEVTPSLNFIYVTDFIGKFIKSS